MKNTTSERKKFKLEHPNNFSFLENQQDTEFNLTCHKVKVEPSSLGQIKELMEPSSLGQFNEPSPAQTVIDKDISNPFMGEVFPKSLLIQLTHYVVEILKKVYTMKHNQKAQDLLTTA